MSHLSPVAVVLQDTVGLDVCFCAWPAAGSAEVQPVMGFGPKMQCPTCNWWPGGCRKLLDHVGESVFGEDDKSPFLPLVQLPSNFLESAVACATFFATTQRQASTQSLDGLCAAWLLGLVLRGLQGLLQPVATSH